MSGKIDMRETNAGGFAVAVSIGGSLGSEDEAMKWKYTISKKSGTMGWFVTHKNCSIQFELCCLARKLM